MPRTAQQEIRAAIGQIQKDLRSLAFYCLYPKCRNKAVDSHSQQKEGQLRVISEDGKVCCLNQNVYTAVNSKRITTKVTGISEASTFPGYCCAHDKSTFAAIEEESLCPNRRDQAALLFLRAVSYEYVSKLKALYLSSETLRRAGRLLPDDGAQMLYAHAVATDAYRRVVGPYYLKHAFAICRQENSDQLHVVWRVLDRTLPLSLTTSICPWLDSFYEKMTSFDKVQPLVSVSIVPCPSSTHVVFSWLREFDDDAMWIEEATADTTNFENLLNLCIAETEDCCLRPSFWNDLDPKMRDRVTQNMRHSMFHRRDDGVRLIRLT